MSLNRFWGAVALFLSMIAVLWVVTPRPAGAAECINQDQIFAAFQAMLNDMKADGSASVATDGSGVGFITLSTSVMPTDLRLTMRDGCLAGREELPKPAPGPVAAPTVQSGVPA